MGTSAATNQRGSPPSDGLDEAFAESIAVALRAHADAERARHEKAYLRSDLEHLGVRVPVVRRELLAQLRDDPVADRADLIARCEALWRRGVHELRLAAAELAAAEQARFEPSDLDRLARWIVEARTWALVDVLAPRAVGPLIARDPGLDRVMAAWAAHADPWLRRAALLAYLLPLRRGDPVFDRFAALADALLEDSSFWVRKALGWTLRERTKCCPDEVVTWLAPRRDRVSRLTLREAVRRLPDALRTAACADAP